MSQAQKAMGALISIILVSGAVAAAVKDVENAPRAVGPPVVRQSPGDVLQTFDPVPRSTDLDGGKPRADETPDAAPRDERLPKTGEGPIVFGLALLALAAAAARAARA